jgi:N-acetyl-beta-hexosaminidase
VEQEGLANEGELQSWFIQRISRYLAAKGRKIVGG